MWLWLDLVWVGWKNQPIGIILSGGVHLVQIAGLFSLLCSSFLQHNLQKGTVYYLTILIVFVLDLVRYSLECKLSRLMIDDEDAFLGVGRQRLSVAFVVGCSVAIDMWKSY